jgi:hypothetical protein
VLNCRFNRKQAVAMTEKPPFLEDGSQYGVSRTQFRRMRKAEKRELMVQMVSPELRGLRIGSQH